MTIINRACGSGNSGKNFCQTVLDDKATAVNSINTVTSFGAPYTGIFRPSNPLSAFDGENPNGTWTLTVIDDVMGDTGDLRAFSLLLTGFTCCRTGCLDVTATSASSGAIGSTVTITGTGFNGVTSVKFGDVASVFAINSNTSITTRVPAGAGIAPIILSKPGCVDAQTQKLHGVSGNDADASCRDCDGGLAGFDPRQPQLSAGEQHDGHAGFIEHFSGHRAS